MQSIISGDTEITVLEYASYDLSGEMHSLQKNICLALFRFICKVQAFYSQIRNNSIICMYLLLSRFFVEIEYLMILDYCVYSLGYGTVAVIILLFIISINRMLKSQKVQKMFIQNHIEKDNYTLVVRLKNKIQQLNQVIQGQQRTIQSFKRDMKTTKINEMEIEIQHLNDQNKRLLLIIDEFKNKNKRSNIISPKKTLLYSTKLQERKPLFTEIKIQNKVYQVLKENQLLKKELVNLKINQNLLKKRKSTLNDRSSIYIEKNLIDYQKIFQKKIDLEAQRVVTLEKMKNLQQKISLLIKRNQQLEKIHHRHIAIQCDPN